MTLTLMTVDEVRERVDTSLTDAGLTALASDCEDMITDWAGPLVIEGYPEDAEQVTETVYARGTTLLRLKQKIGEIISVTDTSGDTDTELVVEAENEGDWRVRGDYLERADGYIWGERTTVVYVPADGRFKRRQALVKLVQLELNFQPGMSSQQAGPWAERYAKYAADKSMILNEVYAQELFA